MTIQYTRNPNQPYNWRLIEQDERMVASLCQKLSLNEITARVMINRGITSFDQANNFLNGKLRDILPDPFLLKDMEQATKRIISAINNQEKITVFADYDVDGATSAALFHRFFNSIGIEIDIYVPNRLSEGYGPNVEAIKKIKQQGSTLMITVDCGSTAHDPLEVAYDIGLDVIIVDHHMAPPILPKAHSIINPNRLDDEFPYKAIAAVAVSFFCLIAIRRGLRESDWFMKNDIKEPDLTELLDLVALGTVCDVMPLTDLNRLFVKQGLNIIQQRKNLGMATLFDIAKVNRIPKAYHLGYVIGPRINAGGRVDESSLGARLLTSNHAADVYQISARLEALNEERKTIENQMLIEAFEYIEKNNIYKEPIIITSGMNWHIGVLGILASRIKDKYNRPTVVISLNNGLGKGSARSIAGINMGAIIASAKDIGIIKEGGGHAMAGGFSIEELKVNHFREYALDYLLSKADTENFINKAAEIYIDAAISVNAANRELIMSLQNLEPCGSSNHTPRFVINQARIIQVMKCGINHITLIVTDNVAPNYKGATLRCIFFRALDKEIGATLLNSTGKLVDLVGTLQDNHMHRQGVQFIIEDMVLYK